MKKVLQRLSIIGIGFVPFMAYAHPGHGLLGEEHYHTSVGLELLAGGIVVVLIAVGYKKLTGKD